MKRGILLTLLVLGTFIAKAQQCDLQLSGYVLDKGTGIPLTYSNVFLEDRKLGTVTDSIGFFLFTDLCPGEYHLKVSHIGCEAEEQFINLQKDSSINIQLLHHTELLDEVLVHGQRSDNTSQISSTVSRREIEENSDKNLADLLEGMTGVSTLRNGSGISKPVIHGLYGNRVAIMNNGIEQAGQQWGNDHAPEIDPSVADHLSVVKGASALAYGGNSLGSVVLVETAHINEDPHLHGSINYNFQSNGLGNRLGFQMEKNDTWAAWRVNGSIGFRGDTRAPNYFLTNSGNREANLALKLEKDFSDQWSNEIYLSTFNTEIGILRGSHIGNLTDLEQAFEKEIPFFTQDDFSFNINNPKQRVGHHLIKVESKYFLNEDQVIKFKYGGQLNDRKEFDVRRGDRSDRPALSMQQFAHFVELGYQQTLPRNIFLKTGIQYRYIDNTNNPETGVIPLIPDYNSYNASTYFILQKESDRLFLEAGGRYDFKFFEVATISQSIPRVIERFKNEFQNYSFSSGIKYNLAKGLKASLNAGYMLRAPEVNELFSFGLHQGVSGIEEGNRNLQQERSFKGVAALDWYFKNKLFVQALAYYQLVDDYIFLEPQDQFRLTIRGAFPVFIYQQTDARISGLDFLVSYEPSPATKWVLKYSHIKGWDQSNDQGLIFIPANNIYSAVSYEFKDGKKWTQNSIEWNAQYVFEQNDIYPEQDFLPPPDAYFLLGFKMGTSLQLDHSSLRFSMQVENLLNNSYRDYLNRLRYFADEPGINIRMNIQYKF